jgi:hypothetical protein
MHVHTLAASLMGSLKQGMKVILMRVDIPVRQKSDEVQCLSFGHAGL